MPKSVQLSGAGVRAFLHALVRSEPGASKELADNLATRGAGVIQRMLVMRDHVHAGHRSHSGSGWRIASLEARGSTAPAVAPTSEPVSPPVLAASAFDPYAFAVEALLIKHGEAALAERLEMVTEAVHLRALARAQRINLDPAVAADPDAAPSVLRQAIVRGAGKRLADRRAAAG